MTEQFESCYRGSLAAPRPAYPEKDGDSKPWEYWEKQQRDNLKRGVGMLCLDCVYYYDNGSGLFGSLETCGHNPIPSNCTELFLMDENECEYFRAIPCDWIYSPTKKQWEILIKEKGGQNVKKRST